jgi:phosphoglycolate phosphatase
MQTANAAGMHAVGVGWGFRGPEELLQNGCRTLVNRPSEILPLLECCQESNPG